MFTCILAVLTDRLNTKSKIISSALSVALRPRDSGIKVEKLKSISIFEVIHVQLGPSRSTQSSHLIGRKTHALFRGDAPLFLSRRPRLFQSTPRRERSEGDHCLLNKHKPNWMPYFVVYPVYCQFLKLLSEEIIKSFESLYFKTTFLLGYINP